MGLPIILLSAGTIKLANDINYLKSFLIIREDGTLFNEENTLICAKRLSKQVF